MDMKQLSIDEFTKALASNSSVPGGGGASALAGALGTALGDMVGEFTVGKKKYAEVEDDIRELMVKACELRGKLMDCINEDAVAFEPLSKAYGIPKDDPARDAVLEKCLREAAAVPMTILRLCSDALLLLKDFAVKGSRLMISDAATGAALCRGAVMGAAVNVKVNTRLMKDREYAAEIDRETEVLCTSAVKAADEIYDYVFKQLS